MSVRPCRSHSGRRGSKILVVTPGDKRDFHPLLLKKARLIAGQEWIVVPEGVVFCSGPTSCPGVTALLGQQ